MKIVLLLPLTAAFITTTDSFSTSPPPTLSPGPPPAPTCGTQGSACEVFHTGDACNGSAVSCYRIPSLITTSKGTLLAFAEARPRGCKPDIPVGNFIAARASSDRGKTWGNVTVAAVPLAGGALTYPAPLQLSNGSIGLLAAHFHVPNASGVWYTRSDDEGASWTPIAKVPALAQANLGPGSVSAPSVIRASKISSASRSDGDSDSPVAARAPRRLTVAVQIKDPATGKGSNGAAWSEDDGASWSVGGAVPLAPPLVDGMSETELVGDQGRGSSDSLTLLSRVGSNSSLANHAVARSSDGGKTWARARLLPELVGTTCPGGIGRNPQDTPGTVLIAIPSSHDASLGGRRNMTVWSLDADDAGDDATAGTATTTTTTTTMATTTTTTTTTAPPAARLRCGVWGRAAGYAAFDNTGDWLLYEAGNHIYDYGIKLSYVGKGSACVPPKPVPYNPQPGHAAAVPSADAKADLQLGGGAAYIGGHKDGGCVGGENVRSGGPGQNATILLRRPVQGRGHVLGSVGLSFRYITGYNPPPGTQVQAPVVQVLLLTQAQVREQAHGRAREGAQHEQVIYTSPPLDKYAYEPFKGYSPPVEVKVTGLKAPTDAPVQVAMRIINNKRNLQLPLDVSGFNVTVAWAS